MIFDIVGLVGALCGSFESKVHKWEKQGRKILCVTQIPKYLEHFINS